MPHKLLMAVMIRPDERSRVQLVAELFADQETIRSQKPLTPSRNVLAFGE